MAYSVHHISVCRRLVDCRMDMGPLRKDWMQLFRLLGWTDCAAGCLIRHTYLLLSASSAHGGANTRSWGHAAFGARLPAMSVSYQLG